MCASRAGDHRMPPARRTAADGLRDVELRRAVGPAADAPANARAAALTGTDADPDVRADVHAQVRANGGADVEPELRARLVSRFDAAMARPSDAAMGALRLAVADFVDRLKVRGLPVEQVAAVVEALLGGSHVADPEPGRESAPCGSVDGRGRVRGWCMLAYRDDEWW